MITSLKPTHLWHLTGKKHFRRMIMDRECTRPPHNQRDRPDYFQFIGITILSALGVMGSFGIMSPKKKEPIIMKCDTTKSKKKCKAPKEPCPKKPDKPMKPCNKE